MSADEKALLARPACQSVFRTAFLTPLGAAIAFHRVRLLSVYRLVNRLVPFVR